jgi:hypothetical protein
MLYYCVGFLGVLPLLLMALGDPWIEQFRTGVFVLLAVAPALEVIQAPHRWSWRARLSGYLVLYLVLLPLLYWVWSDDSWAKALVKGLLILIVVGSVTEAGRRSERTR